MGRLFVIFCADTEDNPPNYVPGWSVLGSDYDVNPAIIRFDWTKFWDALITIFRKNGVPITWFFRVDDGPMKDLMLKRFEARISSLISGGDEIGVHIHTWVWDPINHIWRQTRNHNKEYEITKSSIKIFRRCLSPPLSSRMGWSAMSNEIMWALEEEGVVVDASCEPGYKSDGMYDGRDNIVDWSKAGEDLYHPNKSNYQLPGRIKLLEVPISSISEEKRMLFKGSYLDRVINSRLHFLVKPMLPFVSKFFKSFHLFAHNIFYISPSWSTSIIKRIIDSYVDKAKADQDSFLVGFFHPSDILEPRKDALNKNFAAKVNGIIRYIAFQRKKVDVKFITLSKIAEIRDDKHIH